MKIKEIKINVKATFLGKFSGCIDYNVGQEYDINILKEQGKCFSANKIEAVDNFTRICYWGIMDFLKDWDNIIQL